MTSLAQTVSHSDALPDNIFSPIITHRQCVSEQITRRRTSCCFCRRRRRNQQTPTLKHGSITIATIQQEPETSGHSGDTVLNSLVHEGMAVLKGMRGRGLRTIGREVYPGYHDCAEVDVLGGHNG